MLSVKVRHLIYFLHFPHYLLIRRAETKVYLLSKCVYFVDSEYDWYLYLFKFLHGKTNVATSSPLSRYFRQQNKTYSTENMFWSEMIRNMYVLIRNMYMHISITFLCFLSDKCIYESFRQFLYLGLPMQNRYLIRFQIWNRYYKQWENLYVLRIYNI